MKKFKNGAEKKEKLNHLKQYFNITLFIVASDIRWTHYDKKEWMDRVTISFSVIWLLKLLQCSLKSIILDVACLKNWLIDPTNF